MLPLTVGLWRIFTRPRALRGWRRAAYVLPVASFASYLALAAPLVMRAGKSGKQAAAPVASSAQRLPHTSQDGLVSLELPVDFRETLAKPSTTVLMVSSSVVTLMVGDEVLSDPDRNLDLNQYAARILRRQSELTALAPIEEPSVAGYWGLRLPLRQNLGVRKAELFVTRSRSHFVSFFVFAEPGYDLGDRTFDLVRQARIND